MKCFLVGIGRVAIDRAERKLWRVAWWEAEAYSVVRKLDPKLWLRRELSKCGRQVKLSASGGGVGYGSSGS